jgi:hypothetical protein
MLRIWRIEDNMVGAEMRRVDCNAKSFHLLVIFKLLILMSEKDKKYTHSYQEHRSVSKELLNYLTLK